MPKVFVKVTHDDTGKIIKLFSPDFNMEFPINGMAQDSNDLEAYLNASLVISNFKSWDSDLPEALTELVINKIRINDTQYWQIITLTPRAGFFSRALPITGHATNVLEGLTASAITFMALMIASSNHDNKNSTFANAISALSTLMGCIIGITMYVFSDAGKSLSEIGNNIDYFCWRVCGKDEQLHVPTQPSYWSLMKLWQRAFSLLIVLSLAVNATITGISTYQEGVLLVDRYLNLHPELSSHEREKYRVILRVLVIDMQVVSSTYTELAFQWSFAVKLIDRMIKKNKEKDVQYDQQREPLLARNNPVLFDFPRVDTRVGLESSRRSPLRQNPA